MLNPFQKLIEKQIEDVSHKMTAAAEELRSKEIVGSAGGGAVKVTVSGLGEVLEVTIDPQVISEGDCELIQDLLCAGMREALRKASEIKRTKLADVLPLAGLGMELPEIL